jgi:hypothetical protein
MKLWTFSIILFVATVLFSNTLSKEEKELIEHLLIRNELQLNDLNFLKDWASDAKYKLPIVMEILNEPLHFPVFVDSVKNVALEFDETKLFALSSQLLFQYENKESPEDLYRFAAKKIEKEKDVFGYVETVWQNVEDEYKKAFSELSTADWQKLEYFAYSAHSEPEDSLAYKAFYEKHDIKEFKELELSEISTIIDKIDFHSFMNAASHFQTGFSVLREILVSNHFLWKKRLEKSTKWGNFCIGTNADDIYTKEYAFLFDPSGNDSYNGSIQTSHNHPFYWFLDLDGNDTYQNETIAGLFSVFFGLGIHEDTYGDDFYRGNDFSFSAIFGFQQHIDDQGDDFYGTGLHSLAAGSFGISLLLNSDGNDTYSTTELGEGFGGVLGFGMLLDGQGNDIYFAGGKYKHAPLVPDDFRSLGQGFGFGMRPDFAGGIGVLGDFGGNDFYNGGVYAQGSAYWYALGILIDDAGNDFYNAVYYPQGSGIHLAGGFLLDCAGEDHYYSKHGPGQGAGHDYAVGFLLDKDGDDIYSIEGGNGLGLTNSVGIFIDSSGNDRYERNFSSNYGFANQARDAGGIGLFLDLDGEDFYPLEHTQNNSEWQKGTFGISIDTLFIQQSAVVEDTLQNQTTDDVDSTATIDILFSIASEWAVGANQKRVQTAREFLLQREQETSDYIFNEQLGTKSGLTYRAIEDFAKQSSVFKFALKKALTHHDSLYVKNAVSLLSELKDESALEDFKSFLIEKKYTPTILSALGNFTSDEVVAILKNYIASDSEKIRVITARSLKKINSKESKKLLFQMKNDSSFLIKSMLYLEEKKNGTE